VAGLCCMWRIWWAEALALSLLMFARCRIWLLCHPVEAVAAGAVAAGAVDWSVWAMVGRGVKAMAAPTPIKTILSIAFSSRRVLRPA
jgi:hypothetical protein